MILSALITQCRREFGDVGKSVSVARNGDGTTKLFNVGKFPVIEGSYVVYMNNVAQVVSGYTYDLDNGDIVKTAAVTNGQELRSEHKYAFWRDQNWLEAINKGISVLNGEGFFRQIVRDPNIFFISAGIQKYTIPSGAVDVYEIVQSDTSGVSGNFAKLYTNWSWQQDAGVVMLGQKPTRSSKAQMSYLRNMRTYNSTSAVLDVASGWVELVKAKAGAIFYRSMAGKIAKQGNATIDEGHFSFTNLRAMANDLDKSFDDFAKRKKPTRPAKDIQFFIPTGGPT